MKHQAYKHARERSGIVYVHGTINGQRYRKSTDKKATAANLKWVENNWNKVLEGLIVNEYKSDSSSKSITLDVFAEKALEIHDWRELQKRAYKADYKKRIKPIFGNIEISKIEPSDLKKWQINLLNSGKKGGLPLSGDRVHNIRTVFRTILQDAVDDKIINENPFDAVKGVKKGRTDIKPFFLDEIKIIIENAEGFFKNMLMIAFFTGIRTGELIALEWKDIDFKLKLISIRRTIRGGITTKPKTEDSIREIEMLPKVEEALRKQYELTGSRGCEVFISSKGKGFRSSKSLSKNYWHPLIERCKFEKRIFYNTRHTFASLMLSNGEDVLWISEMMGHKDSAVTLQKYTKYRKNKNIQRAVFIDDAFGSKVV